MSDNIATQHGASPALRTDTFRCGSAVSRLAPDHGRRNHCPSCLISRHVDRRVPGDRAETCRGRMVVAVPPVCADIIRLGSPESCEKSRRMSAHTMSLLAPYSLGQADPDCCGSRRNRWRYLAHHRSTRVRCARGGRLPHAGVARRGCRTEWHGLGNRSEYRRCHRAEDR
ncbi:RNHCP domain-containing protein [Nocardia sp. NPDC050710]|uniref:RNHCP domain-containing protein n=1 Tax=Nocardia sp. NPDC050710 TaxID=3157220 RepID=UPI003402CBF6